VVLYRMVEFSELKVAVLVSSCEFRTPVPI